MGKQIEERTAAALAKPAVQQTFPWERRPDETPIAYAHFLSYRNVPPSERSMRKLAISPERAFRLSRKHKWVMRAMAYDGWLQELGDSTAKHAVLYHRRKLVRVASVSLIQAGRSIAKLDPTKLTVNESAQLVKVGIQAGDAAFGLQDAKREPGPGAVTVGVGVNFGTRPSWLEASETKQNKAEVLVHEAEQVLAEGNTAPARTVETPPVALLPSSQASGSRLKERKVAAPTRKHDDD